MSHRFANYFFSAGLAPGARDRKYRLLPEERAFAAREIDHVVAQKRGSLGGSVATRVRTHV
jgi:hypothetical protein